MSVRCPENKCTSWLKDNLLLLLTLLGVLLGIALGFGLKAIEPPLDALDIEYVKFPGTMLLQALKMVVLPLVIFSIISGISALDRNTTGKMGGYAIAYYGVTTIFAVIEGILMSVAIKPGVSVDNVPTDSTSSVGELAPVDTLLDLIRNLIPANIFYATFAQVSTYRKVKEWTYDCANLTISNYTEFYAAGNWTGCGSTDTMYELRKTLDSGYSAEKCDNWTAEQFEVNSVAYDCAWEGLGEDYTVQRTGKPRENILGILLFSIMFALAITRTEDNETRTLLIKFFNGINDAILKVVFIVIWYSPVGIIFLIASVVLEDDFATVGVQLLKYTGTVLGGLFIHATIVLPIVFIVGTRDFTLQAPLNVLKYIKGIGQALLTAFATGSSSATLPLTIQCLETNNNVDSRVTRFVLPIGATINMDGTALYEAVAAIFIAQSEGLDLTVGDYLIISITATVASIGAAGIPQAGLVTLIIVMTAIGLPPDKISLILAVDPILDRFRTAINVAGDSLGCAVVQRNVDLDDLDEPQKEPVKASQVQPMENSNPSFTGDAADL